MFSPEFLCLGAACDLIKCSNNSDCPPFHTCTGYSTAWFGKGTGLFGGNGLGVGQLLGQPIRGSGGFLSASPAVAAGMIDGVWSALAPELKPPIKTLFNPNFCEPSELRQPSNIVTPGGYFVTADMRAWAPPGPQRVVDLPEASEIGTLYNTPSVNEAFSFKSTRINTDSGVQATGTGKEFSSRRTHPQASINGGLIQYELDMNHQGQAVMVAKSVYDEPNNTVKADLSFDDTSESVRKEAHAHHNHSTRGADMSKSPAGEITTDSPFRPRAYKEVRSTLRETDPTIIAPRDADAEAHNDDQESPAGAPPVIKPSARADRMDGLPPPNISLTQRDKQRIEKRSLPTPASARAHAPETTVESALMHQIQSLDDKQVDALLARLLGEPSLPDGESGSGSGRVRLLRTLQETEQTKTPEGLDVLFDLAQLAAELLPLNKTPLLGSVGLQNPAQFGMNVMNAKWEAQIKCLIPVAVAYSPLGTVILDLSNRSESPSIIRNDLFEAFIKGNHDNNRKPLVSVAEVSNMRDVRRDFVFIVCSRPGRYISKFEVSISFAGQDGKVGNVCPVEVLCEESTEIPASELALRFETITEEQEEEPPNEEKEKKKKKEKREKKEKKETKREKGRKEETEELQETDEAPFLESFEPITQPQISA
ncbi:hypothetical protein BESB_027440 [Besnoitia besnoiti]|uniref:Uncharacterized protein n=1 Tax=Besnoitia besnoiti TaxID=94643 RepID=A0A2A9M024_BESBE|nr:uncharacterized protein BESB_027440 [Besnoitia besnoiti]PFH31309.1 hypothetical protein BESB_027440 [Besnoitia besnoiti]